MQGGRAIRRCRTAAGTHASGSSRRSAASRRTARRTALFFRGDVLVAIDGLHLTTAEGGRRFSQLPPDQPVTLTVRRDGNLRDVQLVTSRDCPPPPQPPAAPPRPPAPPKPPIPQATAPYVWLGFSFECRNCSYQSTGGEKAWTFVDLPFVDQVEPGGPAATAGLQSGDRLTHLDGVAMNSPEAGRRFTALQPGQAVVWTVERRGEPRKIRMVAQPRLKNAGAAVSGGTAERLRYTGAIKGAQVEVRGAPVNVTEDDRNGEILIRSRDLLVRVKVPAKGQG